MINEVPEIAFSVKNLSNKLQSPTVGDMKDLKMCLRYIAGVKEEWLYLTVEDKTYDVDKDDLFIDVYTDADWAGDRDSLKSTSSSFMMMDGFLLGVNVQLQASHARSSAESEFYAMGAGCADGLHAQAIMADLGMSVRVRVRSDASAARSAVLKQGLSKKMRHIEVKFLHIQQLVKERKIDVHKVHTDVNVSDLGTKYLDARKMESLKALIGKGSRMARSYGVRATIAKKAEVHDDGEEANPWFTVGRKGKPQREINMIDREISMIEGGDFICEMGSRLFPVSPVRGGGSHVLCGDYDARKMYIGLLMYCLVLSHALCCVLGGIIGAAVIARMKKDEAPAISRGADASQQAPATSSGTAANQRRERDDEEEKRLGDEGFTNEKRALMNETRVKDLKQACKAFGLPVTGIKEDLTTRLLRHRDLAEIREHVRRYAGSNDGRPSPAKFHQKEAFCTSESRTTEAYNRVK